jgi:HAD superfamily hydrolase (TIGR01458 family)
MTTLTQAFPFAGVRGLLLDLDGVLILRSQPVAGARESLARLDEAGLPYLVATNVSLVSRDTLSRDLGRAGLVVPADRLMTAASAAAAYSARHFAGQKLYVMGAPDALREFDGQELVTYDQAADLAAGAEAPGGASGVAAVVVGDAADEFTSRNMQSAFRLIRKGAGFVAMHKNRWWLTPAGLTLDSGAYVAALEFGSQRRAVVVGKPSRDFFLEGVRRLGEMARDSGAAEPLVGEVAMVGDDLWNDILGAQRAGLRGVFVRSGKHGDADLSRLAGERHGRLPDAVVPSIVDAVDACLG